MPKEGMPVFGQYTRHTVTHDPAAIPWISVPERRTSPDRCSFVRDCWTERSGNSHHHKDLLMQSRREFIGRSLAALGAAAALDLKTLLAAPAPAPKRILILGGTGFVGPHQVRHALKRGHTVTIFNRGRSAPGMFGKDVQELAGDRATDLSALKGRKWDAVIDESASQSSAPEWVKLSTDLLKDSVDQYLFISTRSAYQGTSRVPMTADAPTHPDVPAGQTPNYGQAKAMAERAILSAMPGRVTIVRPGLIIGPGDDTDRFTYWPFRVAKGGEMLAPGDGTDHVQIIDVRDLMEFSVKLVEEIGRAHV